MLRRSPSIDSIYHRSSVSDVLTRLSFEEPADTSETKWFGEPRFSGSRHACPRKRVRQNVRMAARRSRQLSDAEIERLLEADIPARLATLDPEGYPRVVPIWFIWGEGAFHMTSVPERVHMRDLARDPRAAICVDLEDRRTRQNVQLRARGRAELSSAHEEWTRRITLRYVDGPSAVAEADRRAAMERVHIRLRPERLVCIGTPAPVQLGAAAL